MVEHFKLPFSEPGVVLILLKLLRNEFRNPLFINYKNLESINETVMNSIKAAQDALCHRALCNKLAALGKYEGEKETAAASESLYVANHTY